MKPIEAVKDPKERSHLHGILALIKKTVMVNPK
jgi:hypothetical protein